MKLGGREAFTVRGALVAMSMSMVLCVIGQYIAISLGMMPWSTVLVAIIVMAILNAVARLFRSRAPSIDEIVVTQAAGSVGILIGAGVAFVLPGIWYVPEYSSLHIQIWKVGLMAATGGLLGVVISNFLRREFVDTEDLPFPAGKAAGDVLKAGDEGGEKAKLVLKVGIVTGLFTLIRDRLLPQSLNPVRLKFLEPHNIFVSVKFSLLSVAGGYLLGPYYSTTWFLGSVFAWLFLMPLLIPGFAAGGKQDPVSAAHIFRISVGTGIVIGSGVAFLLIGLGLKVRYLLSGLRRNVGTRSVLIVLATLLAGICVLFLSGVLGLYSSAFALLGVLVMTPLAAKTTGETNIDPMEIFGILVFLFATALITLPLDEAFYVICIVTIGAGVAGDIMHDYKAAKMLGTNPVQITKMQILSVLAASLVAGVGLSVLFEAYGVWPNSPVGIGNPSGSLPAPQSTIVNLFVTSMLGERGLPNPGAFWGGFAVGFILQAIGSLLVLLGRKVTISAFSFGIGVFLPMQISLPIFIGGVIRLFADRRGADPQRGDLIAASMMGGEGIVGFLLALQKILPFLAP